MDGATRPKFFPYNEPEQFTAFCEFANLYKNVAFLFLIKVMFPSFLPNFSLISVGLILIFLLILIFTARRYAKSGICRRRVSVCPCVCVCVYLLYCIKTAKRRITQIMPRDRPGTLVFKWDVLYSCRISTDKHVSRSLCNSRASCFKAF